MDDHLDGRELASAVARRGRFDPSDTSVATVTRRGEVVVDHAATEQANRGASSPGRAHAAASVERRAARRATGGDRLARRRRPDEVTPLSSARALDHDPPPSSRARWAITGVPHAIASTTLNPNGSSKPTRCRSARAPPSSSRRALGTDRAE